MQLHLPFTTGLRRPAEEPSAPDVTLVVQPPREPRVEFVRVRRARRYILRVRPDGTLRVTVPRGGSRREAEAFVAENRRWIDRERTRVERQHGPLVWTPGCRILLRGEPVTIDVADDGVTRVVSYGDRLIVVRAGQDSLRDLVEADLLRLAEAELPPRLRELAAAQGLAVGAIVIRNQRSRWGSCARNGNIALNFRLVQMPRHVSDYILLHELMHLRQQNHSRRFWRLVAAACPGFREAERWLRTEGRALF